MHKKGKEKTNSLGQSYRWIDCVGGTSDVLARLPSQTQVRWAIPGRSQILPAKRCPRNVWCNPGTTLHRLTNWWSGGCPPACGCLVGRHTRWIWFLARRFKTAHVDWCEDGVRGVALYLERKSKASIGWVRARSPAATSSRFCCGPERRKRRGDTAP
jgi:hypothetical protein